jgi:hypothetical protein
MQRTTAGQKATYETISVIIFMNDIEPRRDRSICALKYERSIFDGP